MSLPDRFVLGALPTPLVRAPRLASVLGLDELLIKRDDLTGFSFGGNKVRKLEFLIADARARDADTILVMGGPKSNLCQATAEAARVAGLACELILYGDRPSAPPFNLLLAETANATSWFTGSDDRGSVDGLAERRAEELTTAGRSVYLIPRGGATAVGAVGYHLAVAEIVGQLRALGVESATVLVSVGSGGTLGGLVSGVSELAVPLQLVGASVSRDRDEAAARVMCIAEQCSELLGADRPTVDVRMIDARGPGYAEPWDKAEAAGESARAAEGLVLDPIYTAKAAAVLVELAAAGLRGPVVFWHTGGVTTAIDAIARKDVA